MDEKIRVLTCGTFDTLHYGHVLLLNKARQLGDELYVGVSTDEMCKMKGKKPYLNLQDRIDLVKSLKSVTDVFPEYTMEQKVEDAKRLNVNVFVLGDDYTETFPKMKEYQQMKELGVQIVFLSRTPNISSSIIKENLK